MTSLSQVCTGFILLQPKGSKVPYKKGMHEHKKKNQVNGLLDERQQTHTLPYRARRYFSPFSFPNWLTLS